MIAKLVGKLLSDISILSGPTANDLECSSWNCPKENMALQYPQGAPETDGKVLPVWA